MWLSKDGVMNTVALPEPATVLGPDFLEGLRVLVTAGREGLSETLDDFEEHLFETSWEYDEAIEHQFQDAAPHSVLLVSAPKSFSGLRDLLNEVEARWRLDAVMAIQDVMDSL